MRCTGNTVVGSLLLAVAMSIVSLPLSADELNVRAFGATGDGRTDDTASFEKAFAECQTRRGGTVLVPAGTYVVSRTLEVPQSVRLEGEGWTENWADAQSAFGTWLLIEEEGFTPIYLNRASGASIERLAFIYRQPPHRENWSPGDYPPAIVIENSDDVSVAHVNLFNATKGIKLLNAGRAYLNKINGNPLAFGIEADRCHDTSIFSNIQFWRYWEETLDDQFRRSVSEWRAREGCGVHVLRADNPMFTDINVLGYRWGFLFEEGSDGHVSKVRITSADCDSCHVGAEFRGSNLTGMLSNFTHQGAGDGAEVGIKLSGNGIVLQVTNARITKCRNNGIRASGSSTRLFLNNVWIEQWNRAGARFPGIEATDQATVYLQGPAFFDRGRGARNWGVSSGGVIEAAGCLVAEKSLDD